MTRFSDETTLCCPDRIAVAYASLHQARLRHVAAWRRWMAWDGTHWRDDDTLLALDLARDLCRIVANGVRRTFPAAAAAPLARRIGGAGFIAQVQRLASADRLLAAAPGLWDADPDLLNTPAGIVDTRTGELTPHRPDAYMTRITSVAAAPPGTPSPSWCAWLDRMTGGDAAMQFFLQRVAGRALAARSARPGPARAATPASSILVDTLSRILGDDSAAASMRECVALLPRDIAWADAARDPELNDRLASEYPAILRWAIDGALAWRAHGLATPDCVRQAIDHHVAAGDFLGAWLDECVEPSTGAWAPAGALYASWLLWAAASGECPNDRMGVSQKRFSQALAAHGFQPRREGSGQRGFVGLKLRLPDDARADLEHPDLEHGEQGIGSVGSVEAADCRRPDPRPTASVKRPVAGAAPHLLGEVGVKAGGGGAHERACVVVHPDAPTVIDIVATRDPARMPPGIDNRTLYVEKGDRTV